MQLTIELPDDEAAALHERAQRQGVSAETYARVVIQQDLKKHARINPKLRHISEIMADIMADIPPDRPQS
jgi:plasmid stability protein